jgi:hypothetical protein
LCKKYQNISLTGKYQNGSWNSMKTIMRDSCVLWVTRCTDILPCLFHAILLANGHFSPWILLENSLKTPWIIYGEPSTNPDTLSTSIEQYYCFWNLWQDLYLSTNDIFTLLCRIWMVMCWTPGKE